MSTRTIIEINHDYWQELSDPAWIGDFRAFINSGDTRYTERWQSLRVLGERHHGEPEWKQSKEGK